MGFVKDFDRQIEALWHRRSTYVRSLVRARPGRQKGFSRKHREDAIRRLEDLATTIIARSVGRHRLRTITIWLSQHRLRGRGRRQRFEGMVKWAEGLRRSPIIYSFWRGRKCLYVGKSKSSGCLRSYGRDVVLAHATRVKVLGIRGKSRLVQAECLCMHLFQPKENRIGASRRRWSKKCPVCDVNRKIKDEIRAVFWMP